MVKRRLDVSLVEFRFEFHHLLRNRRVCHVTDAAAFTGSMGGYGMKYPQTAKADHVETKLKDKL
jgi:hypothetical protein